MAKKQQMYCSALLLYPERENFMQPSENILQDKYRLCWKPVASLIMHSLELAFPPSLPLFPFSPHSHLPGIVPLINHCHASFYLKCF